MVPRIAAVRQSGDDDAYAAAQSRACEIALGLALPAATGFALLAAQIAGGLFEHGAFGARDTEAVAAALIAICAGLPGHVLEKVFGAVSFAHEDTGRRCCAALFGFAAAIIGGVSLFPRFGYIGVARRSRSPAGSAPRCSAACSARRDWLRLDDDAWRAAAAHRARHRFMGLGVAGDAAAVQAFLPGLSGSGVGRLRCSPSWSRLAIVVYAAALQILGVAQVQAT